MKALSRIIVAVFVGLPIAISASTSPAVGQTPPSYRLYVTTYQRNRLRALDPTTLADLPGTTLQITPRSLNYAYPQVVASASGSTLAAIVHGRGGTRTVESGGDISIRIFVDGKRRGPVIHPPVAMTVGGISPDGSELYGISDVKRRFVVFRSTTGALVGDVALPASCCVPYVYDASAARLYLLYEPPIPDGGSPATPILESYDVASGRLLGSLPLPGVRAGFWQNIHNPSYESPIVHDWEPGFALSPNGRQIAILDGNTDTLTTIDAQTLSIESTLFVRRAPTLLDRVMGLAGLTPTVAEAKEVKGTALTMTYSPDGRSLLVSGSQGERDAQGSYVATPLDMRRVDVATGLVLADRPAAWISSAQFAPDGSAIYVVEAGIWTLLRLDPATLQVTTSRVIGAGDSLEAYLVSS